MKETATSLASNKMEIDSELKAENTEEYSWSTKMNKLVEKLHSFECGMYLV